ncbi:MAG: hypothetical protein Q4B54_13330 [Coriobacteriales bacterium]|nr:hypothetical protein [Coriobacteriales bacterium]
MATMDELVARLPDHERTHVRELAKDALFMRDKLAEAREELESQQLTVPYDNGGGQEGVRKNPAFEAYEALLRSYQSVVGQLRDLLGVPAPKEDDKTASSLKAMRGKFARTAGG